MTLAHPIAGDVVENHSAKWGKEGKWGKQRKPGKPEEGSERQNGRDAAEELTLFELT
jgi:hypothetical protein